MKNYIPLILAVLLGLAAVLAVGRLIRSQQKAPDSTCFVTAVARDLKIGETLTLDALMKKEIPVAARPAQATAWSMAPQMVGQKVWRAVNAGDYILMTDLEPSRTMVGEGEWAITLNVGGDGIAAMVQPGDEIAIIATVGLNRKVSSTDLSAAPREETKVATMVLFPRVRILATGGRGGEASGELVLGLKPQEAQLLIAAQQKCKLTLALRRPGDESAISRLDLGMVDEESFNKLLSGLESVTLPSKPGMATSVEKK